MQMRLSSQLGLLALMLLYMAGIGMWGFGVALGGNPGPFYSGHDGPIWYELYPLIVMYLLRIALLAMAVTAVMLFTGLGGVRYPLSALAIGSSAYILTAIPMNLLAVWHVGWSVTPLAKWGDLGVVLLFWLTCAISTGVFVLRSRRGSRCRSRPSGESA